MTEQERVFQHCRESREEGREIDHGVARVIGAWWHDGRIGDTIAFTSSGYIGNDLTIGDFHGGMYGQQEPDDRLALDMLESYLADRRKRGETRQVPGWDDMWV